MVIRVRLQKMGAGSVWMRSRMQGQLVMMLEQGSC